MTMTREEAIYELQLCVDAWDKWMLPGCSSLDKHKEAIKMALAALRGPTREQVEAWKGEWIPYLDGEHIMPERYYSCSKCGNRGYPSKKNFCVFCGAPMTDEAVDIILQRLEALSGEAKAN